MILQEQDNAQVLEGEDPKPQEWPQTGHWYGLR